MVERAPSSSSVDSDSLESLAAARGITICFAELDGAEGLWLPEERTILLASGLSGRRAAEVLAHELEHVDIEDGHAALDAAVGHGHGGRLGAARWAVAATAAASAVLLFTVRAELSGPPANSRQPVGQSDTQHSTAATVASSPTVAGTTPPARHAGNDLVGPRQRVRTDTVTVTAPAPSTTAAAPTTAPATTSRPAPPPTGSPTPSRGGSGLTSGEPTATNTPQVSSAPPTSTSPPPTTEGTGAATVGSVPTS